jgi:hypothetical protein
MELNPPSGTSIMANIKLPHAGETRPNGPFGIGGNIISAFSS